MSNPTGCPLVKETVWPMLPLPVTKLVSVGAGDLELPPLKTRLEAGPPRLVVALMLNVPASRVVPPE